MAAKQKIAIFTDLHGLLEPTEAILEDIQKRGISEIYSLGDNIGLGPKPKEVMELLRKYNVISIAGNSEEYITLGSDSFHYLYGRRKNSYLWTLSKLGEEEKAEIASFPRSIELFLGGKKIALCHFASDVRVDYVEHSTWTYQRALHLGKKGYSQFLYTNSDEQILEIKRKLKECGHNQSEARGYLSFLEEPLFGGKSIDSFDILIQGHVHWKLYEEAPPLKIYTIRAGGMAYGDDAVDMASYIILTEEENDVQIEEVLVPFDRKKMIQSILSSGCPDERIHKYVDM